MPSFIGSGDSARPSGAVIYQYNAESLLTPGPQASPSPWRSAETVIIRRDGDSVLYLNNLLHSMDAALNLRIPLDRKDVIMVKAVTGERGLLEGIDYHGAKTFAFVQPVPGTDWLVLSKVVKSEALAPLRMEFYILLAVLFLISISVAGIIVFLRHLRNNSLPDTGQESDGENLRKKVQYETILDGITQGCQIIDFEWRHIFINSVAARNSGRTKKELMSHTVLELFPGFRDDKDVSGAFIKCMNERRSQYFEAELDTPDGNWLIRFSICGPASGFYSCPDTRRM